MIMCPYKNKKDKVAQMRRYRKKKAEETAQMKRRNEMLEDKVCALINQLKEAKTLNESFTDQEWIIIMKAKGKRTWHEFLLNVSAKINADMELELVEAQSKEEAEQK